MYLTFFSKCVKVHQRLLSGAQNSSGFSLGLLKEKDLDSDLDFNFSDLCLARYSTQSGSKYTLCTLQDNTFKTIAISNMLFFATSKGMRNEIQVSVSCSCYQGGRMQSKLRGIR